MDHIAHPRSKRPLGFDGHTLSESHTPKDTLFQVWFEISPAVLKKSSVYFQEDSWILFVGCFGEKDFWKYFHYCAPVEKKTLVLHLNLIEFLSYKDGLCNTDIVYCFD